MKILSQYVALCFLISLVACSNESNQIYEKRTKKIFADVIQDSEFAITENNFRITNRLHIGEAIQKRGNANFPQNEVILFCKLTLVEEMLIIEPLYINYCPYKITATEVGKKIIIGTRLLPEKTGNKKMDKIAKKINNILRSVVDYAASEDPFLLEQN
jgi:uncharacterized protein (DUF302 family)